ncbi:MAG: hypothetical protein ABI183_21220 [Polyangiaceae bacterium]
MGLSRWIGAGGFLVASVLAACSSSSTNGTADVSDAGTDGGTTRDAQSDSGVTCCPPDPTPGCCMHYGGAPDDGNVCPDVCDGMPQPNDPGWTLTKDVAGCPVWSNPKPTGGPGTCGVAPFDDGGSDSGLDAQGD